ncbi:hypothetical protein AAMO2058_001411700 [Amorphochlora amoebiformis]
MILTPPPASVALRCLLLVAPLALPIASGHRIDGFDAWKLEHSKAYGSESEEQRARENFERNDDIIDMLNANPEDNAEYSHTKFSDLSQDDFQNTLLPFKYQVPAAEFQVSDVSDIVSTDGAFDWRTFNAVSSVKNQQDCGSCWAFSAVGALEGAHYLKHNDTLKKAPSLSVEQLIECDSHNYACYGGWPAKAYEFLKNYEGLVEEKDYPYVVEGHTICLANQTFNETCGDGICDDPPLTNWCDLTCSSKPHSSLVARVVSYEELPSDEKKMARFLEENGPVSVAIDAGDLISWLQFYKSGIADPWCSKTQLNHAVLLVGYGSENGKAYWVVKNSWGADFGEQGYFRLIMGKGACGLNTKPVIPHAV